MSQYNQCSKCHTYSNCSTNYICQTCNNNNLPSTPCLPTPCVTGCVIPYKAECTFYNGIDLKCTQLNLEIKKGDSVELIIQKLFTVICNNINSQNCCYPAIRFINLPNNCIYKYVTKIKKNGIEIAINSINFPTLSLCCDTTCVYEYTNNTDLQNLLTIIDPSITNININNDICYYHSINYIELEFQCQSSAIC